MAASASLGRGRERKQEVKTWRYTGNFLVLKMFCLLVLLSWGRGGGGKTVCYVSWRNPFHIFVLLFTGLSKKGNSISLSCVDARLRTGSRTGFSEAITRDNCCIRSLVWRFCIWESSTEIVAYCVMHCTNTHERRSLPQRTYSPNREDGGKMGRGGELEMSWLAQGCTVRWHRQRQKPGILISSPAICSFSWTTTFCCSNA